MARRGNLTRTERARALLEGVRPRLWLLVLGPLLGRAVVAASSLLSGERDYRAQVELEFASGPLPPALESLGVRRPPAPDPRELLSDQVLSAFQTNIRKEAAPDPRGQLSVTRSGPTGATLVATGDLGPATRELANDWAQAIVRVRLTQQDTRVRGVRQALDRQIAAAAVDPAGPARRDRLVDSRDRLDTAQRALPPDARVARGASVSAREGPGGNYFLGALAGLGAALLLAVIWSALDRRLRTPQTLAAAFGLPLLGRLVPGKGGNGGGGDGDGDARPAYSRLLARLLLATGGKQPATVLISGVAQSTDTALAAHAVAAAISHGGKTAALVGWRPGGRSTEPRSEGPITVVEEGAGWPDMLLRVAEYSFGHDVVVICAPPVTETPEALAASDAVGAWFVCAQLGATRIDDAVAMADLRQPPAGLIALAAPPSGLRELLVEENGRG